MRAVKVSVLQKRDSFSPTVTSHTILSDRMAYRWLFSLSWYFVFIHARNDTWPFNIQLSHWTSHTHIKWLKKALKAWKRQCLIIFSNDNFLYCIIGLYNLKQSLLLLHQNISHISKIALLIVKGLGKHAQFRSTTFKLSKWSPLVFLCRLLMPLGMGEQKFLAGFHDPKDWTFLAWGAFPTPAATITKAACISKDYSKDTI